MKTDNKNDSTLINRLRLLLDPYDTLKHLECDGLTQVFHRVLSNENIEHTINVGEVIHKPTGRIISLHYWIDVADLRIDYRLSMWLGKTPDVPHGVFQANLETGVDYRGTPQQLPLLPQSIIQALLEPFDFTRMTKSNE